MPKILVADDDELLLNSKLQQAGLETVTAAERGRLRWILRGLNFTLGQGNCGWANNVCSAPTPRDPPPTVCPASAPVRR